MVRTEIHAALDAAVAEILADAESAVTSLAAEADQAAIAAAGWVTAKAEQLKSHLATVHMTVDHLLDNAAPDTAVAAPPSTALPQAAGNIEGS